MAFEAQKIDKPIVFYTGAKLLPSLPVKAGVLAEAFLRSKNIEIKKEHFDEKNAPEGALVVKCTGYKYNTGFMQDNFSDCLAPSGQIYVNDLFQISKENPRINPIAEGVSSNIFAFGDVCLTSLNDPKSVFSMIFLLETLIKNVIQTA